MKVSCLIKYGRLKTINGHKTFIGLGDTSYKKHCQSLTGSSTTWWEIILCKIQLQETDFFQAGKGLKAFKLVKTLNSLKAKNKKEGNEQSWTKLLKKTESYKEIFNLFDKVTSGITSPPDV